ncbi:uncharacterized protein LOC127150362 [Cucumis melo]|uniref:Uncharacterized protein LOC127150362 n=1 Tax=Cucumis melo TaxID=3656 RepID=A0ABM3L1W5_CUCME|nr:uncharacterized protein LOC127150362 [Cucumis melo]
MDPLKCAFGVTSRKFFSFIVRNRGIEIDQSKIDAIQKMPRPKSLHDLRSLQGRLAYIQSIKKYLLNPAVLGAPVPGEPLILYIAAEERSLGTLLAQEQEKGKERALYYLSKTLVGAEVNYSPIEKMCLALFFAIDKLRHYMQAFTVHLVVKADPIKYVLSRPIISGCLAKWAVILQQYDIVYISQKAIKGQALVDFLAYHPIPSNWKLSEDLLDDEVFFTEVALIIGLQMALEIGVSFIEIYGDSKLIINQLSLQYDVKHEDLKPYFTFARQLMERFDSVMLEHVPRTENKRADTLANLATALIMLDNVALNISLYQQWIMPPLLPECQEANPPEPLHQTVASWLFEAWGLDLVGPITPKSSAGHSYILAATDYFSKWAEAIPLREAKKENVAKFIRSHIIYRYGIPHRIVTDNGRQFSNSMVDKLCEKFKFKQYKSSMYNAAANGLAEAFNKALCNLLKKIISKSKRD